MECMDKSCFVTSVYMAIYRLMAPDTGCNMSHQKKEVDFLPGESK